MGNRDKAIDLLVVVFRIHGNKCNANCHEPRQVGEQLVIFPEYRISMASVPYHEQPNRGQGAGKNIAEIGIIIIAYGRLHLRIKKAEKREHD